MRFGWEKIAVFLLLGGLLHTLTAGPEMKKDPLREKAAAGDAESAFYLGNEYFYGENRPANYTLAAYWYQKAADQGIPEAQYNYASCLEAGRGVKQNLPDAFAWYQKAAAQKFQPAQFRMAKFYAEGMKNAEGGIVLKPDPAAAVELLEKLAASQFEPAELELAAMRMGRFESEASHRQAFALLTRVIARGKAPPEALRMLADCYFSGLGCRQDRDKAAKLLQQASDQGDAEASAKLGFLYEYGQNVKADAERALSYYRKAAEAGHPMAQFKYAEALAEGNFPGKTLSDALPWYRKSALGGCPQAFFKLGVLNYEGTGVKPDRALAARYFFQAAKMGYERAQYNLACMFDAGEVTGKPDREAAFYWFMQSARGGNVNAQRRVAECYWTGTGVERSLSEAEKWFRAAAENGDFSAQRQLNEIQRTRGIGFFN